MTALLGVDQQVLAQIVEVSADAIFSEDLVGRLTTWNAAAERLYGCSATDAVGGALSDLLPPETAAQLEPVRRAALRGERVDRFDSWHARRDGQRLPVSVTGSPLRGPDGAVTGFAVSVQDVGERVHLAAELEGAHRALEQHYDALRRSNRDLEQFAYVASHDLSEPLRVMTGFVQLLEKRYGEELDERGRRYVHHVVDGAARMRTLIDDLLAYSQFLSTDRPARRVDTGAVAARVVAGLGTDLVEVGELPAVWSDEVSVTAVLQNLISNGLKFHRPGESARVVVSGHLQGGRVRLDVDDDGIGIEPAYADRVFRMFARLHVREAYAGTGIGLAIVQQIAEATGGRAWVETSPLGGCRASVTLPRDRGAVT